MGDRCLRTACYQPVGNISDALPGSTPEPRRRHEQCAERSPLCHVVNAELDRISGKPDTILSESVLGGGEPSQESSVLGAKLYRLDVIEILNLQHRAHS